MTTTYFNTIVAEIIRKLRRKLAALRTTDAAIDKVREAVDSLLHTAKAEVAASIEAEKKSDDYRRRMTHHRVNAYRATSIAEKFTNSL